MTALSSIRVWAFCFAASIVTGVLAVLEKNLRRKDMEVEGGIGMGRAECDSAFVVVGYALNICTYCASEEERGNERG